MGAARAGAGAVTLLSPGDALQVNGAHLTSIMLRRIDNLEDFAAFARERAPQAYVLGPGFGVGERTRDFAIAVLVQDPRLGRDDEEAQRSCTLVLDADGITSFREKPDELFQAAARSHSQLVLTPHEGEFVRLFPDLATDDGLSKLDKARLAARRAHATVIYKGPDTIIAAPDGRAAINATGAPWLATAGSGDVLAGIVAGLLAQGMPAFEAACAAVWIHAEAGSRFGPGLIAEDLPGLLPPLLKELL